MLWYLHNSNWIQVVSLVDSVRNNKKVILKKLEIKFLLKANIKMKTLVFVFNRKDNRCAYKMYIHIYSQIYTNEMVNLKFIKVIYITFDLPKCIVYYGVCYLY